MAVVQISRIQVRRGQKNTGTGLPQLASGELAWAIDTQELYIGNGAVSEGAPAVGNTKIITQKDLSAEGNIFGLVQYSYKTDQNYTVQNNTPVTRTLQDRLDDQVTTVDFGSYGDYNINTGIGHDDSDYIQFAINQLFLNASGTAAANTSARIVLSIPAGVYKITRPIYIPSYTAIVGAGSDKTIFYYAPSSIPLTVQTINNVTEILTQSADPSYVNYIVTGTNIPADTKVVSVIAGHSLILNNAPTSSLSSTTINLTPNTPAFQFVNDLSTVTTGTLNKVTPSSISNTTFSGSPRNIQMTGMSILVSTGKNTGLQLDAVRESLFEDLKIDGNWQGDFDEYSRGISLHAKGSGDLNTNTTVTTQNNIFRRIKISNFGYAVYAKQDILNNIFDDIYIENTRQGFVLGIGSDGGSAGETTGPRQTQIVNSKFFDIKLHGVYCSRGEYNTVTDCTFNNVGVDGAGNTDTGNTTHYPQIYFAQSGNSVNNIKSDRQDDLETNAVNFGILYAPVATGRLSYRSNALRTVNLSSAGGTAIRLPLATDSIGTPSGTITYTVDYTFSATQPNIFKRSGTILMVVDIDNGLVQLSDEYNYIGGVMDPPSAIALGFSSELRDYNNNIFVSSPQVPYSLLLTYSNTTGSVVGTFSYTYTASS